MHDMPMPKGVPWLDHPVTLHGSRDYECDLNNTAQCDFKERYWVFWYEADHRYALPTVAFFLSTIIVFALGHFFVRFAPRSILQAKLVRQVTAATRLLSYKAFRIPYLNWNSAPLGVLVLGGVGVIYFFCMVLAPGTYYWPDPTTYGGSPPLATRSGWLALACLPFVFATAGKSNLITLVTGISHEKLQVFHRWIAYAFFVCSLLHTFPFIIHDREVGGLHESWNGSLFYWTGVVALLAQAYLTFASISPLRNMAYEWFKFSHFLAALIFVLFLFFHCDFILTSWDYFIATGCLFVVSWVHRQVKVWLVNGVSHRATLSLVENGWVRVCVPTKLKWEAGQHFFVRFMAWSVHAGSIHPFTACTLPEADKKGSTDLLFYIQPQGGFTGWLARRAATKSGNTIRVLLDGPFGGIESRKLDQCERQLVIAGGSGAGWMLPLVSRYLRKRQQSDGESQVDSRLKLVMSTRDVETRQWFEDSIREILAQCGFEQQPADLEIETHYTGGRVDSSPASEAYEKVHEQMGDKGELANLPSDSESGSIVQIRHLDGRPDLKHIVGDEASMATAKTQLGVFVCGPLSMQNDVSDAVAAEQVAIVKAGGRDVYLHMEHFAWA